MLVASFTKAVMWYTAGSTYHVQPQPQTIQMIILAAEQWGLIQVQWNPGFSNPWFLESPDSLNQKLFQMDLLRTDIEILTPIFRNPWYSKLVLGFLSKIYVHFYFLHNIKLLGPTKTSATITVQILDQVGPSHFASKILSNENLQFKNFSPTQTQLYLIRLPTQTRWRWKPLCCLLL